MSVIIDTGCANINSLKFALERLTRDVQVSADPDVIRSAERVFLPGVGSAGFAMAALGQKGLIPIIQALTQPVLGICLGMQLLMAQSSEGPTACLDIILGEVTALESQGRRLPHMGWNTISSESDHPLLRGITADEYFYFVHSFAVGLGAWTLATGQYGTSFTTVLAQKNFLGVQFHPERSGSMGARILKNFLELKL